MDSMYSYIQIVELGSRPNQGVTRARSRGPMRGASRSDGLLALGSLQSRMCAGVLMCGHGGRPHHTGLRWGLCFRSLSGRAVHISLSRLQPVEPTLILDRVPPSQRMHQASSTQSDLPYVSPFPKRKK